MRHLLIPVAVSFGLALASTTNAQTIIGGPVDVGDPVNTDGFTVGATDCLGCLPNMSGPTPGGYGSVNPPVVDGFVLGNPVPGPIVTGVDPIASGGPTAPPASADPRNVSGVSSSLLFPSTSLDGSGEAGGSRIGSGNNPVPLSEEEATLTRVSGNIFYAVENGVGQVDRIGSIGELVLLNTN